MVLIIDDSAIIIERLLAMLEDLDNIQTILHGDSYSAAVQLLAENHPDIVILDINLPDRSGIDLLRLIKKDYPEAVVIMVSNQAGDYYRSLCKTLGATYFIDKSSEFEQIPGIISSFN